MQVKRYPEFIQGFVALIVSIRVKTWKVLLNLALRICKGQQLF